MPVHANAKCREKPGATEMNVVAHWLDRRGHPHVSSAPEHQLQLRDSRELDGATLSSSRNQKRKKRIFDASWPAASEQREHYAAFLTEVYELGVEGILRVYRSTLQAYVPPNVGRIVFDRNKERNRYKDVICIDTTRVVLRDGEPNDYIHANFVRDPCCLNKFICTQGPLANTIVDFWRMILQENVSHIFMLCETVEQGKEKCQQYWPNQADSHMQFGAIRVLNRSVDTTSCCVTIVTRLEVTRGKKTLRVKHHQWRTWSDRGVPQSILSPLRLLRTSRTSPRPTVVHCSAGVGRTGTVVAIEMCLQRLLACQPLDLPLVVQQLRAMRMHSVQTDLQFVYIYRCLSAFAVSTNVVPEELKPKMRQFDLDYASLVAERLKRDKAVYTPLVPLRHAKAIMIDNVP